MEKIIANISYGALAGVFTSGVQYLKKRNQVDGKLETFDKWKMAKTVIVGALVGGGVAASGMQPDVITLFFANSGIILFVENGIKAVKRTIESFS